jgi:hypothetical protein
MEKTFDISLYNDEFFKWHQLHTIDYALKFMDWYIENYKPKSVIDFGCGLGTYLESAYNKKIIQIKGYEIGGEFARKYTPQHMQDFIQYIDCTLPLKFSKNEKFDCVISIEVAEHIDPKNTEQYVKNMVSSMSKNAKILFTAAPPRTRRLWSYQLPDQRILGISI